MTNIRIVTVRAPGLIPSLMKEIDRASRPVVLIPESFTLACETEIVRRSRDGGIFDLPIYSPSSLIREVREMTGRGNQKPISGDGQNMIISRLLHHHREELVYYQASAAQPTLAARIAGQIDDLARARLTPAFLRQYTPASPRTARKLADIALIWEGYREVLDKGFEDTVGQWNSAVAMIRRSGILRGSSLLIYGFDYITHDLLNLIQAAAFGEDDNGAEEVVIGLISDDLDADREIFRAANDSVTALRYYLDRIQAACTVEREDLLPPMDAGIACVEQNIYALGPFGGKRIGVAGKHLYVIRDEPEKVRADAMAELSAAFLPDMSHVHLYYAKNSGMECQYACQTLIGWHEAGIPWEDMAIAVCEQNTLPSLLPLTLSAAGIPFNAKQDQPILMSGYAQYVLSLLRILRLNFCQQDVLRMIKTGLTGLQPAEIMDMENYARENGIHRGRWLKPFRVPDSGSQGAEDPEAGAASPGSVRVSSAAEGPEDDPARKRQSRRQAMTESKRESVLRLESLRRGLMEPIVGLKQKLSRKGCTGKQAAALLFEFITETGIYQRLLEQEEALAARGDDLGIDRNRQVWTAVNDLLDTVATFIGEEPLPLQDLCTMLEASLASRTIKSLPQLSGAVMVAPPQMFFSSGVRCMIVMGMQENELAAGAGILSEQERSQLEAFIEQENRDFYRQRASGGRPDPEEAGAAEGSGEPERPYPRIGQSRMDLAARQKQDVYQAVSLAREELLISCSSAKPSGGIMTPSAAFRRLAKMMRETCPENVISGLLEPGLRPFAPAFTLETLAVRLREAVNSEDSFLRGNSPEDLSWQNALASLYHAEEWKSRVESILKGLHVTVPDARITPEQAGKLYLSRGMTISRVETFGSCPYRHFLEYGLELVPTGTWGFRRDEQGTFNHDVMKLFLDRAMKHPEWPELSEKTQTDILNQVLRERVKQWEGSILTSDTLHRYQGAAIIRGVRTAVASMMRSFRRKPHFLPIAAEVPFGMPDESGKTPLPALRIQTADGSTVAFTGRIDRIDALVTEDGKKYSLVRDNKMSARDVRQNSITAGLQLQLPLYIRAVREGMKDYEAAGGVYQPIREVLAPGEDPDRIIAQIDKELQASGMILDQETVLKAAEPVKVAKRGAANDTVSAVTAAEMIAVENETLEVITNLVNRIRGGEVSPRPVQDGPTSPCAFCSHPDACSFDSTLPGCRIPEIDHTRRSETGEVNIP